MFMSTPSNKFGLGVVGVGRVEPALVVCGGRVVPAGAAVAPMVGHGGRVVVFPGPAVVIFGLKAAVVMFGLKGAVVILELGAIVVTTPLDKSMHRKVVVSGGL